MGLARSAPVAIALLLARQLFSQIDVPTRQAYVMSVVEDREREAAASITNVARTVAQAITPAFMGWALQGLALAAPFVLGGGLKIVYDVLLYVTFRSVAPRAGVATAGDPSITRTGIVLCTPSYMAPERANGMPATPAADLWSLGATLCAALCGRGPFDDRDDALAALSAIADEDPPHLPGDGSLYEIVNALLCRDPAEFVFAHVTR